jgi:hypothetical protein
MKLYKTIVDIDKEDKEDCQSSEDTNCYTMERSSSESSKLIDFSMNGKKKECLMSWRLPWSDFISLCFTVFNISVL